MTDVLQTSLAGKNIMPLTEAKGLKSANHYIMTHLASLLRASKPNIVWKRFNGRNLVRAGFSEYKIYMHFEVKHSMRRIRPDFVKRFMQHICILVESEATYCDHTAYLPNQIRYTLPELVYVILGHAQPDITGDDLLPFLQGFSVETATSFYGHTLREMLQLFEYVEFSDNYFEIGINQKAPWNALCVLYTEQQS